MWVHETPALDCGGSNNLLVVSNSPSSQSVQLDQFPSGPSAVLTSIRGVVGDLVGILEMSTCLIQNFKGGTSLPSLQRNFTALIPLSSMEGWANEASEIKNKNLGCFSAVKKQKSLWVSFLWKKIANPWETWPSFSWFALQWPEVRPKMRQKKTSWLRLAQSYVEGKLLRHPNIQGLQQAECDKIEKDWDWQDMISMRPKWEWRPKWYARRSSWKGLSYSLASSRSTRLDGKWCQGHSLKMARWSMEFQVASHGTFVHACARQTGELCFGHELALWPCRAVHRIEKLIKICTIQREREFTNA